LQDRSDTAADGAAYAANPQDHHVVCAETIMPMTSSERRDLMLRHLEQRRHAGVEELAEVLQSSMATVRRDLNRLEAAGLLKRVHGGAVVSGEPVARAEISAGDEALSRAIVGQLAPGDAVILEGQVVMPLVAKLLVAKPLRIVVISNELEVARTLATRAGVDVIMLGGKVHPRGYTLPQTVSAGDLKFVVATKAFVEVEGLHAGAGATAVGADDARFKRELLQHAMRKYVVAPFSRYGLAFAHRIARFGEIDAWITTAVAPEAKPSLAQFDWDVIEGAA
jgi:DeoR family fructose operon transcriptional repressor